jgi:hypothetical protein
MKMIFLSYKESMDDEVMEMLSETGQRSYTKWSMVLDQPRTGNPKMGTNIWPGHNSAIMLAMEEDRALALFKRVREYNRNSPFEGIKAMSWTLDEETEK